MGKEKIAIYFLLLLIAVFSYMIARVVYKESFRTKGQIKVLEIGLRE